MKSYTHNRIEIRDEVLAAFGFELDDIQSHRRTKVVCVARDTIAACTMHLCGFSSTEAAEFSGFQSHSSTLYGARRFLRGNHDAYPVCKKYRDIITEAQQ